MVLSTDSHADKGELKGFFRIPQVSQFLNSGSRQINDRQLSEMSSALSVDKSLVDLWPVYEKLGKQLIVMHKAEYDVSLINSSTRQRLRIPPLLELLSTQSEEPPLVSLGSFSAAFRPGASIEELVRFVTASSGIDDLPWKLDEHEHQYKQLIDQHPERYSCFREKNPTYRKVLSDLDPTDRLYLPRLMLWRVYGWGLDLSVQKQLKFHTISNGRQFYRNWSRVMGREGINALRITVYGGQYFCNIPQDVEAMERLWNGGLKIWSAWITNQPQNFTVAKKAISSEKMPIYTSGRLSQLLLLGDLVRASIVVAPTVAEMANLIFTTNSGAMKGLEALGYTRKVDHVVDALSHIRDKLNTELLPSVKMLFHGGEVGLFDVEHILCKVARKQQKSTTLSIVWRSKLKEADLKRKSKSIEGTKTVQPARKRRKAAT